MLSFCFIFDIYLLWKLVYCTFSHSLKSENWGIQLLLRVRFYLILPPVESDNSTSWFNQYVIKQLQGEECSSCLSLVDLLIVLPCVFFFAALGQPPIYGYFHVHVHQCNGCTRSFSGCLQQNVGDSSYAISLWSVSAGYSASMLTGVVKGLVFNSSTFSPLSQHLCRYLALPDHDSMNNPSLSFWQIVAYYDLNNEGGLARHDVKVMRIAYKYIMMFLACTRYFKILFCLTYSINSFHAFSNYYGYWYTTQYI